MVQVSHALGIPKLQACVWKWISQELLKSFSNAKLNEAGWSYSASRLCFESSWNVDPGGSKFSFRIYIYIYIQYLYLFIYDIFTRSCFIEEDGNPGKVRGWPWPDAQGARAKKIRKWLSYSDGISFGPYQVLCPHSPTRITSQKFEAIPIHA